MSNYWKRRALEQAKRRNRKIDKATKELAGYWAQTAWEIENDIAAWYTRFAKEQGMSLADARRTLDDDSMDALKMSLAEFEEKAKENTDERWEKELSAASARVHLSRLEALNLQMRNKLYELYHQTESGIAAMVRDTYTDERYHNEYLRQQRAGAFSPVASIPDAQIDQALKKPWAQDGRHWSSRLWGNREQLANKLQGELMRVLIQGKSPVQAGKRLAQQLHVGETQAIRLMQTECTYIQTLADKESAQSMGVKKMQYLATLEAHTCGTCGELDEKVFPIKDLIPGISAPPIHPHCRCTLVPYFEDEDGDRWMREPESGKSQAVKDMSFTDWQRKYIITRDNPGKVDRMEEPTPYSNDYATVAREPDIAYNDDKAVESRFSRFCMEYKDADIEHAVAITKNGEVYHFTGRAYAVDITAIGDKLRGAKVIHNHPDSKDHYGDCFSSEDFTTFFECGLKRLEVISGLGHYSIEYEGKTITPGKSRELYLMAERKVLDFAFKNQDPIEYEQLDIMKYLSEVVQGLRFRRCKK